MGNRTTVRGRTVRSDVRGLDTILPHNMLAESESKHAQDENEKRVPDTARAFVCSLTFPDRSPPPRPPFLPPRVHSRTRPRSSFDGRTFPATLSPATLVLSGSLVHPCLAWVSQEVRITPLVPKHPHLHSAGAVPLYLTVSCSSSSRTQASPGTSCASL